MRINFAIPPSGGMKFPSEGPARILAQRNMLDAGLP